MTVVTKILRLTPGKTLFFQRTRKRNIEIFLDVDWESSIIDWRSTFGYCSFIWGEIGRNSVEAELCAMAQGICEGIWLNKLLKELRVPLKYPIVLYCDNQAAISIAQNPIHHDRTKHVKID